VYLKKLFSCRRRHPPTTTGSRRRPRLLYAYLRHWPLGSQALWYQLRDCHELSQLSSSVTNRGRRHAERQRLWVHVRWGCDSEAVGEAWALRGQFLTRKGRRFHFGASFGGSSHGGRTWRISVRISQRRLVDHRRQPAGRAVCCRFFSVHRRPSRLLGRCGQSDRRGACISQTMESNASRSWKALQGHCWRGGGANRVNEIASEVSCDSANEGERNDDRQFYNRTWGLRAVSGCSVCVQFKLVRCRARGCLTMASVCCWSIVCDELGVQIALAITIPCTVFWFVDCY
jgi:hypothetical protein